MWNPYGQMLASGAMGAGGFGATNAGAWGAMAGAIGKPQPAAVVPKPTANAQKMPFMNQPVAVAAKRARNSVNMSTGELPAPESFSGELRFSDAMSAHKAVALSGTDVGGQHIVVELDARSKDGTKVMVKGLPPTVTKEDLREFFGTCGHVAFATVKIGKPAVGQVRFQTAEQAQMALGLSGSIIDGYQIQVHVHAGSKDGTKLAVFNLPPDFEWQDLKDHFSKMGTTPNFAETSASKGTQTAEVRYAKMEEAQMAAQTLHQSWLGGGQLNVKADEASLDGCKLVVSDVPPGVEWQELKDHFMQVGTVAFAGITDKGLKAGGGQKQGKGGFGGAGMNQFAGGMNQLAGGGLMGELMVEPSGLIVAPPAGMGNGMCCGGGMAMGCGGFGGAKGGCKGGCGFGGGCCAGAKGGCGLGGGCGGKGGGCGFGGGCGAAGKGGCGSGGGGGKGSGSGIGEVRFDNPMSAQAAVQGLDGSMIAGQSITVARDMSSQDGTKVLVSGCGPGVSWQELKDHFAQAGKVCFAAMK